MKIARFINVAKAIAAFSKDKSTKVGAVIVGPSGEIRSTGWNGAPRGCTADEDERSDARPEKYYWFSHAEMNAITNAARVGTPLEGTSIVVTHAPCMDCARAIVQAGIKRVVFPVIEPEMYERWKAHFDRAELLFDECNIEVEILS